MWKQIPAWPRYSVSDGGGVFDHQRGRLLAASRDGSGYLHVTVRDSKHQKTFSVHRLVAEAFVTPRVGAPLVNHIDGCKTNNVALNLEWVTFSENVKHGHAIRGRSYSRTSEEVEATVLAMVASKKRNADITHATGLSSTTIWQIVKRHGQQTRNAGALLSEEEASALIRDFSTGTFSTASLGKKYGVTTNQARLVIRGQTWTQLPRPYTSAFVEEVLARHVPRAEGNGNGKLTDGDVAAIRAALDSGGRGMGAMLAVQYNVSESLISKIRAGKARVR